MRIFYSLLYLCSIILIVSACKSSSVSDASRDRNKRSSQLQIDLLEYDFYTAKAKIYFEDLAQEIKANADIRLKKDSVIWISMRSGTGIEGVRALITADSIQVINRLEKEYYAYSFEDLSRKFKFEFDFDMMQSIIVGNIPLNTKTKNKIRRDKDHFIVNGSISKPRANLIMYVDRYVNKVDQVQIIDRKNQNDMLIEYGEFKEIEGQEVPHTAKLKLNYTDEKGSLISTLEVDNSRISLPVKPIKFSFRIPDKYQKVDITKEK